MLYFNRWSRKGYGSFVSLGRVIKLGVLPVTMSIITLSPKGVAAQEPDSLRVFDLNAISITAEKLNPTRGVVTPTAVYDRDTTFAAPLQTIESALKLNPSIDLRERGSKGVQADISLRGSTFDQSMVLLNGINFTDARTGHQTHSLPIDIEAVNSIDIISGLSGIGAYAGALNLTTTPLKPNYIRAELTAGEHGYAYASISGAASANGLSVMAVGSLRKSDGYTTNTDFNTLNIFTRVNYSARSAGFFDIQAGYQNRSFGANSFYSFAYPNQFEHTTTALASARWFKTFDRLLVSAIASYRRNDDVFELFRDGSDSAEWYTGHNYHVTDNVWSELKAEYRWVAGKTSLGIDYTYNHIYSNVLGEDMATTRPVPHADAVYTKAQDRSVLNLWLRHSVTLKNTHLAGTVNIADSPYGLFPSWSISARQQITRNWDIDLSSSRAMRLPTFTDLYYTTATHEGNPNLKPEKSLTTQLSTNYRTGGFSVKALAFHRLGTDVIDWVKKPSETKWQSTQATKANTFGAEVYVAYKTSGILKNASLSYGYINTVADIDPEYESKYALDFMKHKVALNLGIRIMKGLTLDVSAAMFDRNGKYTDINNQKVDYKPYCLLDARLNWHKGILNIYIDATNILNQEYFDFGGLVQAPRWSSLGVVLTI